MSMQTSPVSALRQQILTITPEQAAANAREYLRRNSPEGREWDRREYKQQLTQFGITISMSEKASPWQNGHKESFYSQYKLELGSLNHYQTVGEIYEAICIQMHYYNTKRIHTALRMPPRAFRVLQETNCRLTVQKLGT